MRCLKRPGKREKDMPFSLEREFVKLPAVRKRFSLSSFCSSSFRVVFVSPPEESDLSVYTGMHIWFAVYVQVHVCGLGV